MPTHKPECSSNKSEIYTNPWNRICDCKPEAPQKECKHEWQGKSWQPQTQICKLCGVNWREVYPKQEEKPPITEEQFNKLWDLKQNALLDEVCKRVDDLKREGSRCEDWMEAISEVQKIIQSFKK